MDTRNDKTPEQANREASERMERNDEDQNRKVQQKQNELTQSTDPHADDNSLLHNPSTGDSISTGEQNDRRLKESQDEDFGSEQIK